MALTKQKTIKIVSKRLDLDSIQSKGIIEELPEILKSTLASEEDVMINDFGKFQVNKKLPRKRRNPATGEEMILEGRKIVTFKCSNKLRDKINKKYALIG